MRRRRNQSGEGGGKGVDLAIIITPMLDMAFQLLAFFIMTYHPPAQEAAVDGSLLPPAVIGPTKGKKDNKSVIDPLVKTQVRIIVKAVPFKKDADQPLQPGQPTAILLELPPLQIKTVAPVKEPGAKAGDSPADWTAALKALAEELAASRKDPALVNLELSIDADRPLRYGYVIAVREVAEASGYKKIGFNAPR
jgi:biopolymer transport protein ExbD